MKTICLTLFGVLLTTAIISSCKKNSSGDNSNATLRMTLTSPADGIAISGSEAINFSWAGSSSNSSVPMSYKFTIVDVISDQTLENAIGNKPIFEKDSGNWVSTTYPLTAGTPGFVAGHKYAWQVIAKQAGLNTTGGKSEIRSFTVLDKITVTLDSPADGSTISNSMATDFSWSGSSSNSSVPMSYKITIAEVTGDQKPENAIGNKPFFEKDSLKLLHIQYPLTAVSPGFKVGSKYVWQVTAKQQGVNITGGASSLSLFTVAK